MALAAILTFLTAGCSVRGPASPPSLQATPTSTPTAAQSPLPTPTLTPRPTSPPPRTPSPTPTPTASGTSASPQPLRAMRVERAFPALTFLRITNLVQPDDGSKRIFVTEQPGRILVFPDNQGAAQAQVFLDIRSKVSEAHNEEGLLGLAFAPAFSSSGHFYVYYSAANPRRSILSRFTVSQADPNMADPTSELIIMEIPQPFGNHNGGQLVFGPDGFLYIGLGDGGGSGDPSGNGQNLGTLLGAILRIDVSGALPPQTYRIPPDNPFVNVAGARGEIWAYGLRNPWRFSFDRATGRMWAADVGQNRQEETDIIMKGGNYGWNKMEGSLCFSPPTGCNTAGLEMPVAVYGRDDGCSVTGGFVYRGPGLPSLQGAYVYGDFCSGKIWGLRHDGRSVTEHLLLVDSNLSITSFAQDVASNLYILSRNEGIYRLAPVGGP
ncbi:MAG: PQQ-dependent sugar dehydrogenase [Chloroflexi bacterium]|nr:PQQ-dependent sugar dehydrogenase [Chloroflexota bacterium]